MNTYEAQQDARDAETASTTSGPHDSGGPVSGTEPDAPIFPTFEARHLERLTPEERRAKEASLRISNAQLYAELAEQAHNEKTARMFRNYREGNVCGGGGHEKACYWLVTGVSFAVPGGAGVTFVKTVGPTGTRIVLATLAAGSKQAAKRELRVASSQAQSLYWGTAMRYPRTTYWAVKAIDMYGQRGDELQTVGWGVAVGLYRVAKNSR